jgi:dTDP-glucose pyrophosphorylase
LRNYKDHLIKQGASIKEALPMLDTLASDAILFVIDDYDILIGSLTDGDVRRGLMKGMDTSNLVDEIIQPNPRYIDKNNYSIEQIIQYRKDSYKIIPVTDSSLKVINVINFTYIRSYLPVDALIMAGGRGSRLRPLTDEIPKPLLKVGNKPIMEHNLDRLRKFGVDDFWVSLHYKGEQIEAYFGNGADRQVNIEYVWENKPMGTIGAVSSIDNFKHQYLLITNSDLLTNMDYEDFFLNFIDNDADMAVATIPYSVEVPYAVMETSNNHVLSFREKPTYTYYSNAGIYLIKKELLGLIPKDSFYNSTDLMQKVIEKGLKLVSYPLRSYWLDIGKHEDFQKANSDINHLEF